MNFQDAINAQKSGELQKADKIYKKLLNLNPENFEKNEESFKLTEIISKNLMPISNLVCSQKSSFLIRGYLKNFTILKRDFLPQICLHKLIDIRLQLILKKILDEISRNKNLNIQKHINYKFDFKISKIVTVLFITSL